ncbi:hypothetical protein [Bradyrhizobium symbiodeficiens]|uniref:hypothetical protein n=1 Tax=Bradyrhizobium symbiodeficiens TaxID=1404367 RepID=UPI000BA196D3|nr:hypothetical protein [Bradyrhizobium symbiodeficiens]AWM07628.1 hypothetical protein CIT39_15020 [Bradyrhizobium symbiodeficiens]
MQEANVAYQQAAMCNDIEGMAAAAQQWAGLRASARELDIMAREASAAQQPRADASKYGLTPDEVAIARGMSSGDRNLSNDERERTYAEQKHRYQTMRANGTYRDQFR